MKYNDETVVRAIVQEEIQKYALYHLPIDFYCPSCNKNSFAMRFVPKVMSHPGGSLIMNEQTMIGRECLRCGKKFIPSQPKPYYEEGE
jgi:transcription elongation factor Elf1